MDVLIVVLFAITLIYLSVTERFSIYTNLIGIQGLLLFFLAFSEMEKITLMNLLFITTETLVFKVLVVPYLLYRIIGKTGIEKVHQKSMPGLYSLLFVSLGLILSIIISHSLHTTTINMIYFIVAFFSIYTGLFLIITHKKIFSHLIGFLVLENAVLLLSLAIGSQMPMLINIGILLDIFVSVLILGIFMMRMKQSAHQLTMLKDD